MLEGKKVVVCLDWAECEAWWSRDGVKTEVSSDKVLLEASASD